MGFEKALRAVEVINDQIQYGSQSLLNLARGHFSIRPVPIDVILKHGNWSQTSTSYRYYQKKIKTEEQYEEDIDMEQRY